MRRSNKCECCSRGRSKVIFGPVVLSWRKVYEPGLEEEWGRSGGVGHWAMQHNAAPQPLPGTLRTALQALWKIHIFNTRL